MATKKKMLQAAAGGAGGAGLDITEVFSTYLYTGNGGNNRDIVNNIDLSGEGGLVWTKNRDNGSYGNNVFDTARGAAKMLITNTTAAEANEGNTLTQFNSNGFRINDDNNININTQDYASFTFRKAPKFFTCLTYSGTGSAQNISHDLGSVPGMIIVKRLDSSSFNWQIYHKNSNATPEDYRLEFTTGAAQLNTGVWGSTAPTDTHFTVGVNGDSNGSGGSCVAYLFAHNDGDGAFGPDGDQDIIKCGSYTHAYAGTEVNLGFEPQWILFKAADQAGKNWYIFDAMRGIVTGGLSGDGDAALFPNTSGAENVNTWGVDLTATGFIAYGNNIASSGNIIYMAIRRGPLAPPEAGTEVFAMDTLGGTSPNPPGFYSGWPVDLALITRRAEAEPRTVYDRLRGSSVELRTNDTSAEQVATNALFDQMNGYYEGGSVVSDIFSWMWKRAPGFFDCVAYLGENGMGGSTDAKNHNLGVVPEMIWIKTRSLTEREWVVWVDGFGTGQTDGTGTKEWLYLNTTASLQSSTSASNVPWGGPHTATTFSTGSWSRVNDTGETYIAYLFASLAGVSKVGSYTGSNSVAVEVDCGFTSGARFVLIKRTDAVGTSGNWYLYDSVRGIVSGADDPYLLLNTSDAEASNTNNIEPLSSGFKLTIQGNNPISVNGGSYVFYAIA